MPDEDRPAEGNVARPPKTCATPGCSRPATTKESCAACYARVRRGENRARREDRPAAVTLRLTSGTDAGLAANLPTLAEARKILEKTVNCLVESFGWPRDKAEGMVNRVFHGKE